jgi:hypothetical protein
MAEGDDSLDAETRRAEERLGEFLGQIVGDVGE